MVIDLLLIASLGFLGSFGHCLGMCGPITAAFSFSEPSTPSRWHQVRFHLALNLGRLVSYVLVGVAIGALGSVLLAGGQLAGVGSVLRRAIAIFTGALLLWMGLTQVIPGLPKLPLLHPLAQDAHGRLSSAMVKLSLQSHWWTPIALGLAWGLIPCGFLYTAQIKAAETGAWAQGAAVMLAFGLGTFPTMLGVGVSTAWMSRDRRSQLFRLGGWITIVIGLLTMFRTGDTMTDYSGHAAIVCLMLALVARPLSRLWAGLMRVRRVLGVSAFVLTVLHTLHTLEHSWQWNPEAFWFLLVPHQWSVMAGAIALILMAPAAFTSFDQAQKRLGRRWRSLHLMAVPALILSVVHAVVIGSHYLGGFQPSALNLALTVLIISLTGIVLLMRWRKVWSLLSLERFYVPPT